MAAETKVEPSDDSSDLKQLCNTLYEACISHPKKDPIWSQDDLFSLDVIPAGDVHKLQQCTAKLTSEGLLKYFDQEGRACWKLRSRENVSKLRTLNPEAVIVYGHIESAGQEGVWERTITRKSNLHEAVIKGCIKILENKHMVKSFKNARQPRTKSYILFELQPLESATGGLFYEFGDIDKAFVKMAQVVTLDYIHRKSWYRVSSKGPKRKLRKEIPSKEDAEAARAEVLEDNQDDHIRWLPMPPAYTGYPMVPEITKAINALNAFTEKMVEAEIEKLLDLLRWDGLIEKVMDGRAYKSILSAYASREEEEAESSSLTEAPCGRCPVADFCDETGPVNARTCPYFQDWLAY